MKKILLIEPNFPIPAKSKNHKNFLPIGLLKIASYLRENGNNVKLIRGTPKDKNEEVKILKFKPDEIWVTSLFTYWAEYVRDAVRYYKNLFPNAKVKVGGIYASLTPKNEVKKYTGCDEVYQGVHKEAERYSPAYDLVENTNPHKLDYQIIHASRGCERMCEFCGTWKIEPEFKPEKSIKEKIEFDKLVFYDNNLLANPHIEDILQELINLKKQKRIDWCESQSGFDGRVLLKKPHLAKMIKQSGFRYPRIAWDWKYNEHQKIKEQIDLFLNAGYNSKDIFVFMLYNWDISFDEMENKRIKCWEWKVQIADCRFRPLNQFYDNYKPLTKNQTIEDYYIHEKAGWTDALVKQFRKNVREQNICVRQDISFYSASFERKRLEKEVYEKEKAIKNIKEKTKFLKNLGIDYWFPKEIRHPNLEL